MFACFDIVVWQGIVAEYGSIKNVLDPGANVRMATESEKTIREIKAGMYNLTANKK